MPLPRPALLIVGCGDVGLRVLPWVVARWQVLALTSSPARCAELRAAGVKLACLTNKEHRFAVRVLGATGLLELFDYVVGGDSLPHRKPDARTVQHLLNVLGGHSHRAAHVGDSRTDVETARNAGVAAWAVPWGYNAGEPIATAQPERIFDSLPDIASHVLDANREHLSGLAA